MLGAHNACERSIKEYTAIFEAADPGFSYVGATGGVGMHYTLLEYKYSKPSSNGI